MGSNRSFTELIKRHLDKMAAEDKAFAEKYADESKNLNACATYITEQARKQAVRSTAVIEDEVVFGWAAHYYQETNEDLANEGKEKAQDAKPKEDKVACTVSISKPTKLAKKQEKSKYIELDLFGGTL